MSILSDAKEVAELIKKLGNQDLYEKIVSLRDGIFELREENLELKEKVKELESASETDRKLVRQGNYYVFEDDADPETNNKFCLTCWDHDRKLVGLHLSRGYQNRKEIRCTICTARRFKK